MREISSKLRSEEDAVAEEDLIKEKYARRKSRDERYSWFNSGHVFMVQERERQFLELLKRAGVNSLEDKRILEIGCGQGFWLREFIKWGARPENITGVDLLKERVEEAVHLTAADISVVCGSGAALGFPDETFDLVLQSTVFTSIQNRTLKLQVAAEMVRVLRPMGLIFWYDFRLDNPRNRDVTGVPKKEVVKLFRGCQVEMHAITLAPPLARCLAPWSWLCCHVLGQIPLLCTHYLGIIRKPNSVEEDKDRALHDE
jgi:ubiquinone/menaquinone biosynthesis C-methylase UbiE